MFKNTYIYGIKKEVFEEIYKKKRNTDWKEKKTEKNTDKKQIDRNINCTTTKTRTEQKSKQKQKRRKKEIGVKRF